jgi:tetratricopeptide (TPR) repeat protein
MSNDELELLKNNIGGFILINSFLLTTIKQQIQTYFSHIEYSNDLQCVLFDIEADPRLENIKPFSNITTQSFFPDEEQTLFMLGTIFRLISVRHEHSGIWIVRMILCSENNEELKLIHDQNQTKDSLFFGQAFCDLKRFDDAEKYYHHLIKSLPSDHEDIIFYYNALGNLEKEKGDYDLSLEYFKKLLEIRLEILEDDHKDIGDSYNNIGEIYQKKNDFKQALEFYQKAFQIRQKHFPQNHPQLANSYKNIATAYEYLNNFDQALENYNQSLKIYENSASPQYCIIGITLKSVGSIYENKKQYQQARSYYEKAMTNFRYVLSPTDHHITQLQQDIQRVTTKLK